MQVDAAGEGKKKSGSPSSSSSPKHRTENRSGRNKRDLGSLKSQCTLNVPPAQKESLLVGIKARG